MNKKARAKSRKVMILILTMIMIAFVVVCVRKVNRIQNEKDIIGTWKDSNVEEIFTFQENGELSVSKDMLDLGLSCGNASYSFPYSDVICVTQGDASVEFEIKVDRNKLTIFFMGQEYLKLEK